MAIFGPQARLERCLWWAELTSWPRGASEERIGRCYDRVFGRTGLPVPDYGGEGIEENLGMAPDEPVVKVPDRNKVVSSGSRGPLKMVSNFPTHSYNENLSKETLEGKEEEEEQLTTSQESKRSIITFFVSILFLLALIYFLFKAVK
jgi:hypothetical protein